MENKDIIEALFVIYFLIGSFLLGYKVAKKEVIYTYNFELIIIIPLALIFFPIDYLWNILTKKKD